LAALWRLAIMIGMRRGEILGLRWSDVNPLNGHLSIRSTLSMGGEKVPSSMETLNHHMARGR
jgi:integrase